MMRKRKGYKVYPLTVAQKFHLYYLPFCPTAAVLNIGTSLTIEEDLDWDLLAKSINQAYARSEGMRIRFAKDKEGNWYQYVGESGRERNRVRRFYRQDGGRGPCRHAAVDYRCPLRWKILP